MKNRYVFDLTSVGPRIVLAKQNAFRVVALQDLSSCKWFICIEENDSVEPQIVRTDVTPADLQAALAEEFANAVRLRATRGRHIREQSCMV